VIEVFLITVSIFVLYDEKEELLSLYSMTDRGFRMLVDRLNSCNYSLSYEPDMRVNMAMVETANEILKKRDQCK